MKVYIPDDIPNPSDRDFVDEISEFLKALLIKSRGKTFVLFTSYSALNYVYYLLRDDLEANGIELFIHGMAPRTHLVNMYVNGRNPVLLEQTLLGRSGHQRKTIKFSNNSKTSF